MEIISRSAMRCFSISLAMAVLSGCGGGDGNTPPAPAQAPPPPPTPSVSLYKTAGSVQCTGGGLSLPELQRQLNSAEILVLSSACGSDGKMYPAACGAPDGRIGIFQVPEAQAQAAAKLGFAPLSELPDATRVPCQ
jgi:hypothetical protein